MKAKELKGKAYHQYEIWKMAANNLHENLDMSDKEADTMLAFCVIMDENVKRIVRVNYSLLEKNKMSKLLQGKADQPKKLVGTFSFLI